MRLASFSPSWNDGSSLLGPRSELDHSPYAIAEKEIIEVVQQFLLAPTAEARMPERRREQRQPYPHPVRLTPVGPDGKPLLKQTVVVIGRNLSRLGFDFYHIEPIPHRRVIASFDTPNAKLIAFLLDLSWCHFGEHGFYDGGGKFLRVVDSPLEGDSAA